MNNLTTGERRHRTLDHRRGRWCPRKVASVASRRGYRQPPTRDLSSCFCEVTPNCPVLHDGVVLDAVDRAREVT
jgi:hypothetical protein